MAVSNKPWDGSASKYSDTEAYCKACLIDANRPGQPKVQANCHLPVREPGGAINRSALGAAAAALAGARGGIRAEPAQKAAAARKLLALYSEANMQPPDSLKRMAR